MLSSERGAAREEFDLWSLGDSMRFYMGSLWTTGRADLSPIYRMIFRRLKGMGADWRYYFPELGIVDFGGRQQESEIPMEEYSPSEAFAEEQKERERQEEVERMREDLEESNRKARLEALDRPPPDTVIAYQTVFGNDPEGWPPA